MPTVSQLEVDKLVLDLDNFRTIQQTSEKKAIETMIALSSTNFWALLESLISNEYYPTENILVLRTSSNYLVKEGNRRIAALKIARKQITSIPLNSVLQDKVNALTPEWMENTKLVPCVVYDIAEIDSLMKQISLIHGKNEKAGRDAWTSIARARFDRNIKHVKSPVLDLLENYLRSDNGLSETQLERWSGDYPLTVLQEALSKLVPHLKFTSIEELCINYPDKNKLILNKVMFAIGIHELDFPKIRKSQDFFGYKYGIRRPRTPSNTPKVNPMAQGTNNPPAGASSPKTSGPEKTTENGAGQDTNPASISNLKPQAVYAKLKQFTPHGSNREKLTALVDELKLLKIEKHPHSFCFLLRSLIEISAKIYADEHRADGCPSYEDPKRPGTDKILKKFLGEIYNYITTKDDAGKRKEKTLIGLKTEMNNDNSLFVDSLNQLIHNTDYSMPTQSICVLFNNLFPFIQELNT